MALGQVMEKVMVANMTAFPGVEKMDILLIDDNYDFYLIIAKEAESWDGVTIDYAPDGFSANHLAKRKSYDVVVCDVYMPHLNGLVLTEHFKKTRLNAPVILISSSTSDDIVNQALKVGAYNVLQKPIRLPELIEKAQFAIEISAQSDSLQTLDNAEMAHLYNALKTHYYDVDKIIRAIRQNEISIETIRSEIDKKDQTGKCLFDDLKNLKFVKNAN